MGAPGSIPDALAAPPGVRAPLARAVCWVPLLVLALGASCSRPRPGTPPEHVLLVTFEGLRADHCAPWQYPRPTTSVPVGPDELRAHDLDLIAESGVVFAHAFAPSAAPSTSLLALHTGRAPAPSSPAGGAPTLAEQLSAAGFDTAAFVLPSTSLAGAGLERGFESYAEHGEALGLLTGAAHWLFQVRDPDRPHFLWLHIGEAAWPWDWSALPTRGERLDYARLFLDPDYPGDPRTDLEFLRALQRGEIEPSAADRAALIAAYDGQIARAVLVLREFLEYYKHNWQDVLVVVAGVNGMELGERGNWGVEGSLHDGGLHVPLILRHPGSLTGRRIQAEVVELADVLPTVLDWFDLEPARGATGRSLLPLVDTYVRRSFDSRPALAWGGDGAATARDERWRLILGGAQAMSATGGDAPRQVELYDLEADPRARVDVAARHPEVVGALRAALEGAGR